MWLATWRFSCNWLDGGRRGLIGQAPHKLGKRRSRLPGYTLRRTRTVKPHSRREAKQSVRIRVGFVTTLKRK
jgi:hypothetical protein